MKKLLVIAMVMVCGFLSSAQAQLPGNPANPHGTLIDRPGVALAKWERVGTDLYWEFTLTTPNTFISGASLGLWNPPCVQFWASNSTGPSYVLMPGSMDLIFDAGNFPYGSRYYSGIIDLSDYDSEWTSIQADYIFYIGNENEPEEVSDSVLLNNEELDLP